MTSRSEYCEPASFTLRLSGSTCPDSASTTHYAVSRENRLASGITDGTIRLSVGLEDAGDLVADIRQALDAV